MTAPARRAEDVAIARCPRCEGGGAEAHRPLSRCIGCDGTGQVPRSRIVDCERCGSDALGELCGRCEERSAA